MAFLSTQETSTIEQNIEKQFKSRKERRGDWGFDEVMFAFFLPGCYSLVFIDERDQLELDF